MKKIVFITLFALLVSISKSSAITKDPLNLAIAASAFTATVWLFGETLKDCGHRYLQCKKIALSYAKDLKQDDTKEILTDREILGWSTIQGISAVPEKYWRELTAFGLQAVLMYIGIQSLRDKL